MLPILATKGVADTYLYKLSGFNLEVERDPHI
jgi:hypothetical protein